MKTVKVDLGSDSYRIEIGRGLLSSVGEKLRQLTKAEKIAVVTDDHVRRIYGERIREILKGAGFDVKVIAIPAGEASKNLRVFGDVLEALAGFDMSRSDALVTLSGGVPGDLGGFAAASYMRGIDFFQIPTTILAQIDSSVGGKVAVDLRSGKNLAGAFYQPKGVFIDPDLLSTLPTRYVHDGLAEAVKYGCIGDRELFELFESIETKEDLEKNIEEIILRSVLQKTKFVEEDVAIGMSLLSAQSEKLGYTERGCTDRLRAVLKKLALPTAIGVPAEELIPHALHDKKRRGKEITLVVMKSIGRAELVKVPTEALADWIVTE